MVTEDKNTNFYLLSNPASLKIQEVVLTNGIRASTFQSSMTRIFQLISAYFVSQTFKEISFNTVVVPCLSRQFFVHYKPLLLKV